MSQSEMAFIMAKTSCWTATFMQPSPETSLRAFQREETGLQEKIRVYKQLVRHPPKFCGKGVCILQKK